MSARYFALSKHLGHLICRVLGVSSDAYDQFFGEPEAVFAFTHYPPLHEVMGPEAAAKLKQNFVTGMGAHRDGAPFVTLLIQDEGGLEVLNHAGEWIEVRTSQWRLV